MFLRMYRADSSMQWTTLLNSAITVPDRNVGDFRLSYGNGYFMVYFSVFGINSYANGSNAAQISFVSDYGELKTTAFEIPGQDFIKTGEEWGCSHALAQLAAYHSMDNQFLSICSADLYPSGILIGGSPRTGTVALRSAANGHGLTSAQLGQAVETRFGFLLIFNAQATCTNPSCDCCDAKGIGLISIYNEKDEITGKQATDDVIWLTSTNGSFERDPAIAKIAINADMTNRRERVLTGWYDRKADEYMLGIVNAYGFFERGFRFPVSASNFRFTNDDTSSCDGNCVMWGNRDDSFKSLPNGKVGWIYAAPRAASLWLYEVGVEGVEVTGWSLWTSWSRCSRSCGTGEAIRIRLCLSENCETRRQAETAQCNTNKCKTPVTCTFEYMEGYSLTGELFVNGQLQFGVTMAAAEEKCSQLRDLCEGITRGTSSGFELYFLRSNNDLTYDGKSKSAVMTCSENPGWSSWSTWFACSEPCDTGRQVRNRFCDGGEPGSSVCQGNAEESLSCNTGRCPAWSEWSDWSLCSTSCDEGVQDRSRICTGDYPEQCGALAGPSEERRNCSLGECSEWLPWGTWSTCSMTCGPGMQERIRTCSGDFVCPLEEGVGDVQSRSCSSGVCPYWDTWRNWSQCGQSCGPSTRTRNRECLGDFPLQNGCPLPGDPDEIEECNLGECPNWGKWGTWSNCLASCGNGLRTRIRLCLGDFPESDFCVSGGDLETEVCDLGECALLEQWQPWSDCSVSCGDGIQTRFRLCVGDFPCPEDEPISTNTACNLGTCPSWSAWASWGPCTVTCGDEGNRTRTRECLGDFPALCEESGYTNVGECDRLTGCPRWTSWTQWGGCSEPCGSGTSGRTRTCAAAILETCYEEDENESTTLNTNNVTNERTVFGDFIQTEFQHCSMGMCSYWQEWGPWGACSTSCDMGQRIRSRDCFGDFPETCFASGQPTEREICTSGKCGSWGAWLPWGECSQTCGRGTWRRRRECLGDFLNTCLGSSNQTASCDINDCVDVCIPNPCNNGGNCRANEHLTRQYHCACQPGWMGKHCDHLGPDLICGSESILISFDRQVASEEGLLTNDPSLVSFAYSQSIECTAFFDHFNTTEYYLLILPSPLDSSCGSSLEVRKDSYRIRNQVIWQIEDYRIRSTVILVDFTCVYLKNATVSSDASSQGRLAIESYKRQVEVVTESGVFQVDISLFRDSSYRQAISVEGQGSLVSLSEGEIVFVSVDLRARDLLPSDDAVLVMDSCFVTSSTSDREPLVYLLRNSCPVTPLVTVISNGNSRSGRFSVRVFGWTGTDVRAGNVFIHCTVSVCNRDEDVCEPECEGNRRKRSLQPRRGGGLSSPLNLQQILHRNRQQTWQSSANSENTRQTGAVSNNAHPYTNIVQVILPTESGEAAINLSSSQQFDPKKMVSIGPFEIVLKLGKRRKREIRREDFVASHQWKLKPHFMNGIFATALFLTVICTVVYLLERTRAKKRRSNPERS